MRKLTFLLACLLLVSVGLVNAQSKSISGKVVSADDGQPIIGASITVKGISKGTISGKDGGFSISVPSSSNTLVVSYIGMKPIEVVAKDGMVVELKSSSSELGEVMVVAFGTTTKKSFTGSASVVKAKDIEKRQSSNITNSLAGQVSGVQGMSSNGQPGTGSSIRIRGIGSFSASNAPLYVVDGVPYDADISAINNADVESVTVLKDAASNALYGARGANGVIMITTKRGKTKEAQINVDAKWGSNSRAIPSYNVMTDPGMYYETFYRALYNSQSASGSAAAHAYANKNLFDASQGGLGYQVYSVPNGQRVIGTNFKLNPNATLGYTKDGFTYLADNWYNELFNANNLRQEYNVNISGSNDNLTYFASVGSLDDTGIISNSDFSRLSTRANVDYQAKKWLKVGTNMSYSQTNSRYPGEQTTTTSSGNLFFLTSNIAPIYPLYNRDANGNIMVDRNGYTVYDYGDGKVSPAKRPFMSQSNPASDLALNTSNYVSDFFIGKWYAAAELFTGFKLTANLGITTAGVRYNATSNPFYGQYAASGGNVSVTQSRYASTNTQYLATYKKSFNEHNFDFLAGFESYNYKMSDLSGYKQKIFQSNVAELNNAIVLPSTSSSTSYYKTMGALAQVKYDYNSKYYASASFRRDGSSCFAPENRWGNFWSVGGAWDINKESFMGIDQINLLKLKVSYGAQGNDKLYYAGTTTINLYPYIDQFDVSENNGTFAAARSYKGNKDITWETSYNFNAGVDFSMFHERLNGTIEGFSRKTVDMLYYKPSPASGGYTESAMNVGSVRNAGFEFDLHYDVIKLRSLTWNVYANATLLKNKIIALDPSLKGQWIDGNYIYKEGESMYNFYIRKYAGVDATNGSALWYKDVKDASGKVTGQETTTSWSLATQYEMGDILPKVYGGFGTSLEAYGFDVSVAFAYQLGGRVYDSSYARLMHSGNASNAGQNWSTDILNAWTPENTNTDVPRVNSSDINTNSVSDRFLVSSDYLSLQNINLGYSLPSKLLKKVKITKVRIYGVADNVGLISFRKGLDPRQSYTTSNASLYTPIRSISGGVSITF